MTDAGQSDIRWTDKDGDQGCLQLHRKGAREPIVATLKVASADEEPAVGVYVTREQAWNLHAALGALLTEEMDP
ncbi:MAG TPA: hypothetical protein VNY31_10465 [Solirubrobacteraceae bacterium]|jgi:hypothetical protein|nr:hypothetical protein [Solirubrobacteraceae bacterium]